MARGHSCLIRILNNIFFSVFSDEGALVKGAKKLGFSFNVRTPTSVIINAVRKAPGRGLGGGTLGKFGWECAACFLKPLPYCRPE